MWKMCVLLAFLLVVPDRTVQADDLAKLKAALAERAASFEMLKATYLFTGPSPNDLKEDISNSITWEKSSARERVELRLSPSDSAYMLSQYDGKTTLSGWFPATEGNSAGSARIYKGAFSFDDSQSNRIALVLGVSCNETGGSLLHLLEDNEITSELPETILDHECLLFHIRSRDRAGSPFLCKLTVDPKLGWMPLRIVTETKLKSGKSVQQAIEVTKTTEIRDQRSERFVFVPLEGEFKTEVDGSPPHRPMRYRLDLMELGVKVPETRFLHSIPDGFRVYDETGPNGPVEKISGGAKMEKAKLQQLAAEARQLSESNAIPVRAEPEEASWGRYLQVGLCVVVVAASLLYVQRMRSQE